VAVGVRKHLSARKGHGPAQAAEPNHVLLVDLDAPFVGAAGSLKWRIRRRQEDEEEQK